MGRCEKLLAKARRAPSSLTFRELCYLAACSGFELKRIGGSHRVYDHPRLRRPLPFQRVSKMAKTYQVQQLLTAIKEIGGNGG